MWAGILTWLDASPARFETAAWAVFAMAAAAAAAAAIPPGVRRWWRSPAIFAGLALLRLTGRVDYTGARLVSASLAWVCVLCAWLALAHLFGDGWARLLVLPLLAVHAFSDSWSFVAYGSEHVPDALVALASALLLISWGAPGRIPNTIGLLIAGLALGAVPFAKPQGAPIAAWVVIFAVWQIARQEESGRHARTCSMAALLGGVVAVPAIILLW